MKNKKISEDLGDIANNLKAIKPKDIDDLSPRELKLASECLEGIANDTSAIDTMNAKVDLASKVAIENPEISNALNKRRENSQDKPAFRSKQRMENKLTK